MMSSDITAHNTYGLNNPHRSLNIQPDYQVMNNLSLKIDFI